MKILVTGSSGLVGTALVRARGRDGHRVGRLMRPEGGWGGVGGAGVEGGGGGDSGGTGKVRDYFVAKGRRAGEDAAAVQAGGGREVGIGAAVDVVGDAGGCGGDFADGD